MLSQAVQDYIRARRAAGFKFEAQAGLLSSFAAYADARGEHYVRASIAVEWAGLAAQVPQRARRLWAVTRFARHARADDPRHEVPPPAFGGARGPRRTPYILSQNEIARLLQAARCYGKNPLQGATYSTLFGLLACTGLRISEAIRLRQSDITSDGLLILAGHTADPGTCDQGVPRLGQAYRPAPRRRLATHLTPFIAPHLRGESAPDLPGRT